MDIPSSALLASLASLSHRERLIQLKGPEEGLVVERFEGTESVCGDNRLQIDCLATDAFLELESWLEQPLTLQLRQADGALRQWHGLCTEAAQLGSDGGLARYRLILEPWTALLRLRRNAVIFQDQDTRAICEQIFTDYPQAVFRFDVQAELPVRAITTQYRETDWAFVTRLLAEAGLAWRIEQAQGGEAAHTLVVFEPGAELPDRGTLRFHRADMAEARDGITAFAERQQLVPNASTVASWHSEQVGAVAAQSSADAGSLPALEVYVQPRAGRFAQSGWADAEAQARLDALRVGQVLYSGSGSERQLAAGSTFSLAQHPQHERQAFQLLAVQHVALNNLDQGIADLLGSPALERGAYRNSFIATGSGVPLRALPQDRPTLHGPQTARVVGIANAAVTPNREHQVRIQFGWQRGSTPNPGGLTDTGSAQPGHAPGDHTSGSWVAVAEWVAGPNWGTSFLPRVGSEVLVEFLHGDIDQPRITGQLYNGEVAPPFGGGIDENARHPGVLSGLHTQAHDGSGTQQWLMDDTPGQLRTRLHSSLADSRLELGYLIAHQDTARGALRGEGFELATQGWGNVHASEGLLLSASLQERAASTVMDNASVVAQLKGAERSLEQMQQTLAEQQVPGLAEYQRTQQLREQIDPKAQGRYTGDVNGQERDEARQRRPQPRRAAGGTAGHAAAGGRSAAPRGLDHRGQRRGLCRAEPADDRAAGPARQRRRDPRHRVRRACFAVRAEWPAAGDRRAGAGQPAGQRWRAGAAERAGADHHRHRRAHRRAGADQGGAAGRQQCDHAGGRQHHLQLPRRVQGQGGRASVHGGRYQPRHSRAPSARHAAGTAAVRAAPGRAVRAARTGRQNPYTLDIGGQRFEGELGSDGSLMHEMPEGAKQAKLKVCFRSAPTTTPGNGHLDLAAQKQIDEHTGLQSRLKNLGFYDGAVDGDFGQLSRMAMQRFHQARELVGLNTPSLPGVTSLGKDHDI